MIPRKNPWRQLQGAKSKAAGKTFEARLDASFAYYKRCGAAIVEKTPEPMRPTTSLGNGKFIAFFEKKAQPDYKGIMKGGRTVLFEAKYTTAGKIEQSRVSPGQSEYLTAYQALGARCYILAGFSTGRVYRVPWNVWQQMKERFGRKYVTENDLLDYRVVLLPNGALKLLG